MAQRKSASDSMSSAIDVMAEALRVIEPPAHEPLFDGAEPYWSEIIKARANVDWPAEDLTIAAKLANAMLFHKNEQALLFEEGGTIVNASENTVTNPRVTVEKNLISTIKQLRQDLQIHGRGKNGEARDVGKRRGQRKAVQSGAVDDVLIARPSA